MRPYLTFVLAVLNLVVFLILFLFQRDADLKEEFEQNRNQIFSLDATRVNQLTLSTPETADAIELTKVNERWQVTQPVEWTANPFAVRKLLGSLVQLKAETSFSTDDMEDLGQRLSDYGLDDPQLSLSLLYGNDRYRLFVGIPTQVGERVYARTDRKDRVFVISRDFVRQLEGFRGEMLSRQLFTQKPFEARTLTIQTFAGEGTVTVRVDRDGNGGWVLSSPVRVPASKPRIESTISRLSQAEVGEFLPARGVGGLDFSSPSMRLVLEGEGGLEEILVGDIWGDQMYLARKPPNPLVFTIPASLIETLNNGQLHFRERKFFPFDPEGVDRLEVKESNRSILLQRIEDGTWQIQQKVEGREARLLPYLGDPEEVSTRLSVLSNLRALAFPSDAPSEENLREFGLDEPVKVIEIGFGGSAMTLEIGAFLKDQPYWLASRRRGQNFIHAIDSSILDFFPVLPMDYRNRSLLQETPGSQLMGFQVRDLDSGETLMILDRASLESVETHGDRGLLEQVSRSVLFNELASLQARNFVNDSFNPEGPSESLGSWRYVIEMRWQMNQGVEVLEEILPLYLIPPMGGTRVLMGFPPADCIFTGTQDFLDAWTALIETRPMPMEVEEAIGEEK